MNKTPRERIESLLKIHEGHCFIVNTCADFDALHDEALVMMVEGICSVNISNGEVRGLDIKKKGYRVERAAPDEVEPPTH